MRVLKKTMAIRQMNELGASGKAFFFLIDFDMLCPLVVPLDALADAGIYVKFPLDVFENEDVRIALQKVEAKATAAQSLEWLPEGYSFEAYEQQFSNVMAAIREGNSFLLNLTCETPVHSSNTLSDFFEVVQAKYTILYKNEFLVFSPETFVRIQQGLISASPMKGTLDAGIPNARKLLLDNPKETAEHATIVDLIRNDLSMIASDVRVSRFRYIDEIKAGDSALLQVSSDITGQLPANYSEIIGDLVFALLPAGSVTGAPKKRTVELIKETETYQRGFYTGVAGIFDGKNLDSTVLIRFLEKTANGFVYKSGGGITSKSEVKEEYNEMIRKIYVPIH